MDNGIWEAVLNSIRNKEGTTLIQSFLDAGHDVDFVNDNGRTMLNCAASCGNMEAVKLLVKNGANVNRVCNEHGKPTHSAAWSGHQDIVMFFLNIGVDIDCRDLEGSTMLHYACLAGQLDLVKFLLDNGSAINAKDFDGIIPLFSAVIYEFEEQFEVVQYLVECGADVHYRAGIDGLGVLHFACREEATTETFKYLLKKVPDPNILDYSLCTPMHYAAKDNLEVTEHLLNVGADFNIKNTSGETPWSRFIRGNVCLEGISLFLEKGAYFQFDDYNFIVDEPSLKEGILQDVKLCTQSVINKFNHADLPKVYETTEFAQFLPAIEKMKIASNSKREYDIAERVNNQIQTQGYCNVLNIRPTDLHSLCIGTLVKYIEAQLHTSSI